MRPVHIFLVAACVFVVGAGRELFLQDHRAYRVVAGFVMILGGCLGIIVTIILGLGGIQE